MDPNADLRIVMARELKPCRGGGKWDCHAPFGARNDGRREARLPRPFQGLAMTRWREARLPRPFQGLAMTRWREVRLPRPFRGSQWREEGS